MSIDLDQHARELDQLEGISLEFPRIDEHGNISSAPTLKYTFKEETPGLRILPAEESQEGPKDAGMIRLNEKCAVWVEVLEEHRTLVYGLICVAACGFFYMGKVKGWW